MAQKTAKKQAPKAKKAVKTDPRIKYLAEIIERQKEIARKGQGQQPAVITNMLLTVLIEKIGALEKKLK